MNHEEAKKTADFFLEEETCTWPENRNLAECYLDALGRLNDLQLAADNLQSDFDRECCPSDLLEKIERVERELEREMP